MYIIRMTSPGNVHPHTVRFMYSITVVYRVIFETCHENRIFAYPKTNAQISFSDCEADQRLCFRYTDSTIPLPLKSDISSFYPSSVADRPFCVDMIGNPEDRFSRVAARLFPFCSPEAAIEDTLLSRLPETVLKCTL